MKISEQWLREWVDPPLDGHQLAEQLTMAGLEVDGVEPAGGDFTDVVIGRVIDLHPHPDADKLRVARVDIGADEPVQIVCGAPNVRVGLYAPVARIGARLPGGLHIERTELRGVESQGMLCSARELGLGEAAGGLLELPDGEPGVDLHDLLQLDDRIIEVDLTPNRGDCLSIAGVAREVGVLNRLPTPIAIDPVAPVLDDTFPVELADPADCPRYVGRVIRGVDPGAPTPLWMTERLRRAGARSLGPLVDVTNYVMLELGQPLHAFDLAKLHGRIVVRRARAGERLELLNGQTVEPDPETLLITDGSGPIALAGIMGGVSTECDDATRDVFLESAFFAPLAIAGRARRYGLHTDASHRFERGVDPELQARAVERATRLLVDIAGGRPGPLTDTVNVEQLPPPREVALRAARLRLLLGADIPTDEVADILQRLGMTVTPTDDGWRVVPPGFRFDITIEADLIEEIGRIHGYDCIPSQHPVIRLEPAPRSSTMVDRTRLRQALLVRDYQEVITYSFIDPQLHQTIDPEQPAIALSNPISSEMAVMRTSIWPGLLKTLQHNRNRQQERVRLFELGLNFRGGPEQPDQRPWLAGLASGTVFPEQWGTQLRSVDFFDLKGDVEALLSVAGLGAECRFTADRHPALHPGQSARIERNGEFVGWLGALHPRLARTLDLSGNVYLFELRLDALAGLRAGSVCEPSRFPASRRDLAIIVAEDLSAEMVLDSVRELAGERLHHVSLFDVYRGKGIPEGHKSLAFGLILQDFSSNLTDQAVDDTISRIISGLAERLDARLRD